MPSFLQTARVTGGHDPVPDWREVMEWAGDTRQAGLRACAQALWMWLHARASRGDRDFTEAFMPVPGGPPVPGWHLDGFLATAYEALWPGVTRDYDSKASEMFQRGVNSLLRSAVNVVKVRDPERDPVTGRVTAYSRWFVSRDYHEPRAAARPGPAEPPAWQREADRLTPAEAGETRDPEPVQVSWRHPARAEAGPEPEAHPEPEPARSPDPYVPLARVTGTCRVCGVERSTQSNTRIHEKNVHFDHIDELFPLRCPVPGCTGLPSYQASERSLIHHIALAHPEVTPGRRDQYVTAVMDHATAPGDPGPVSADGHEDPPAAHPVNGSEAARLQEVISGLQRDIAELRAQGAAQPAAMPRPVRAQAPAQQPGARVPARPATGEELAELFGGL